MKKSKRPPRLADRLFEWYCSRAAVEDLHGDMEELFYKNITRMPVVKAKAIYWAHVISFLFSYAIKKRKRKASFHPLSSNANSISMLQNYFKVATRNLAKHRFFTIINVLGLAIGMSLSLMMLAMLSFLATYDDFHLNGDRIYRVITNTDDHVRNREFASAPSVLAEKLKSEFTGIEKVVRVNRSLGADAVYENTKLPLSGYFVDPDFLNVFTFPLLKGSASTALQKPNSILITERAAKKMFDDEDPIGKVITMGSFGEFEVTGLLKDIPKNSHMQFEVLCPFMALESWNRGQDFNGETEWKEFRDNYVYILLPDNHNTRSIENFMDRVAHETYSRDENFTASFELQALHAIVPGTPLSNSIGPEWDLATLGVFAFFTLLILLPACFNYTNISISRALKRAKEIGLRKVVGGQRSQIFFQFIVETVIIVLISLLGAYGIFALARPEFLSMLVDSDALDLSLSARMISYFIGYALFVGLLAGVVPAIYFSKLSPIQALKNSTPVKSLTGISFRKALIVAQFALSLGFIMSVVIVVSQYRSTLSYDFGFNQENILDVDLQGVDPQLFRNEFDRLSAVQSVSMSSGVLGTFGTTSLWVKEAPQSDSIEVSQLFVDHNYLSNLNIQLLAGKNFVSDPSGNKNHVIVNEEFIKEFKLSVPTACGKTILLPGQKELIILGVVKNFNYSRLTEPIKSFFFRFDPAQFSVANLKIASTDIHDSFTDLEAAWKKLGGESNFKSRFFDDEIEEAYAFYFSMIKICAFLGILAISISCLGLLGMVVYTAETRTKEIGVRKVMGATTHQLTMLLSRGYINLMIIAALIATPITYLFFDLFALNIQYYRANIGILEIVISLGIMLLLGVATIMSQTIKAARSNPVDTLRYE